CCCDSMEITTGSRALAGVMAGAALIQFSSASASLGHPDVEMGVLVAVMICCVVQVVVSILAIFAVIRTRPVLMLPMLVCNKSWSLSLHIAPLLALSNSGSSLYSETAISTCKRSRGRKDRCYRKVVQEQHSQYFVHFSLAV
ncbi:hypothetical protein PMAYCL1PPCAC_11204, partial [Pristionchus mayeri]